MKKLWMLLSVIAFAAGLALLAAVCPSSVPDKVAVENNPLFEETQSKISSISFGAETASGTVEAYRTEDAQEIVKILALFNEWMPSKNAAPSIDWMAFEYIDFGGELTIQYSAPGAEHDCYGFFNGKYYHLPAAFCDYADGIYRAFYEAHPDDRRS